MELAKLKAYAARQVGAEAARAPTPPGLRGDLRKPARLSNLARVVRRSADEDEGVPPCLSQPAYPSLVGSGVVALQNAACAERFPMVLQSAA